MKKAKDLPQLRFSKLNMMLDQAMTRRVHRAKEYTIGSQTGTTKELAEKNGLNYQSVKTRLHKGWTLEQALSTPVK